MTLFGGRTQAIHRGADLELEHADFKIGGCGKIMGDQIRLICYTTVALEFDLFAPASAQSIQIWGPILGRQVIAGSSSINNAHPKGESSCVIA